MIWNDAGESEQKYYISQNTRQLDVNLQNARHWWYWTVLQKGYKQSTMSSDQKKVCKYFRDLFRGTYLVLLNLTTSSYSENSRLLIKLFLNADYSSPKAFGSFWVEMLERFPDHVKYAQNIGSLPHLCLPVDGFGSCIVSVCWIRRADVLGCLTIIIIRTPCRTEDEGQYENTKYNRSCWGAELLTFPGCYVGWHVYKQWQEKLYAKRAVSLSLFSCDTVDSAVLCVEWQ